MTESDYNQDNVDDTPLEDPKPITISSSDMELAVNHNITFNTYIGSGSYAKVFRATYKSRSVALKISDHSESVKKLLYQELEVLSFLKV